MNGVKDDELHTIERVIASPDEDAIGGTATYCIGCGSCAVIDGAADVFLEIVMQPFLGFDDIVPDSSSPATV